MKIKTFIITLLIVIIPLVTFRIIRELKYRNVSIIADYNDIVDNYYTYKKNIEFHKYLKELSSLGLTSIFIFQHNIDNFLSEYNEVMLLKGFYAGRYFPNYIQNFKESHLYLIIPKHLLGRIKKNPEYKRKFIIKNYIVLEFSGIHRTVRNIEIEYKPYYYEDIQKSKIELIEIKKIDFTKEIDNFIIKRGNSYYIEYPDNKDMYVARAHSFLKDFDKKRLVINFVNENFRAVVERKVRVILLRKIYVSDKSKFISFEKLLNGLTIKLKSHKFSVTTLNKVMTNFKSTSPFYFTQYIIALLVTFFLYLNYLKKRKIFLLYLVLLLSIFLYFKLFYLIVLLFGFYFLNDIALKYISEKRLNGITYIQFIGYTFLLGLTASSLVWNFLGINKIIGIKLIFALPFLFLIFQYFFYNPGDIKLPINFKHLIIITVLGIIGIIVLLRSGNYYIHPSGFEMSIRESLEKIFIIRPRFKEFLIGYPFLAMLFVFHNKSNFIRNNFIIFYILGLIGISTTINSFLHLHTDIIITLVRSLMGIIIGTAIGSILGVIIKYIEERKLVLEV